MTLSPKQKNQTLTSTDEPRLTMRTAMIVLAANATGVAAGVLSYMSNHDVPAAVLVGSGAAGSAVGLFHTLLSR